MKLFVSSQIKEIDQLAIEQFGITSFDLMEKAANAFISKFTSEYTQQIPVKVFCGHGNNGGDGLAIARKLKYLDYKVEVFVVNSNAEKTTDNQKNNSLLKALLNINYISSSNEFPRIYEEEITIDALVGAGLTRPLQGIFADLVKYLNESQAIKIAVDIPSGVPGEGIVDNNIALKADSTYTFQFPFISFFHVENAPFIGKWEVLDIGIPNSVLQRVDSSFSFISQREISIKKRDPFGHKGTFGHALMIAGSKGMSGAAVLSAKACLKAGCGMLTVHTPESVASVVQHILPEAICSFDEHPDAVSNLPIHMEKFDSIGIGPGLAQDTVTLDMMIKLLGQAKKPIVLDADALNLLASNREMLNIVPENSILTPHPGEFARLFGKTENTYDRILLQQKQAIDLKIIIVLKGRYTSIALPSGEIIFNSTGNAGMATAGSGDVLTGIITSFLAQGYSSQEAAIAGVFIHGLAGDCAIENIEPESVLASDIINHISHAFRKIKMSY